MVEIPILGLKVNTDGFIRSIGQARESVEGEDVEHRRLARGWRRTIEVCERLRRQEDGRPVLELVKDKNSARARAGG